eukprot:455596-Amphidinium_carterae.1
MPPKAKAKGLAKARAFVGLPPVGSRKGGGAVPVSLSSALDAWKSGASGFPVASLVQHGHLLE